MFSFIKEFFAELKRQRELEQKLDAALIDPTLIARMSIAQSEARIIEQAAPTLNRIRKLKEEFLIGGTAAQ